MYKNEFQKPFVLIQKDARMKEYPKSPLLDTPAFQNFRKLIAKR